jgi:sulfur carrier protein
MEITINGELKSVREKITVQQLLQDLGILEQKLALEINQEIVPRSNYSQYQINSGDQIEIIHAIGGG